MKLRYWKLAGVVSILVGLSVTDVMASTLTLTISEEIQTGGIKTYSVQNQDEFSKILTNGSGSASLASLKSFNSMTSGASYINRSAWELTDVFLTPDTPGTDSATVIFGGQLTAVMGGFDNGGVFDGATSILGVEYLVSYDLNGTQRLADSLYLNRASSFDFPNDEFSLEIDEFVDVMLTLPTTIPITFAMTLLTVANVNGNGSATVNAANSLTFDPDNFLNILTPGVTANAGSFVVDNTIPAFSAVPVPAAVWLFGSGLIGLIGLARKNKNKV